MKRTLFLLLAAASVSFGISAQDNMEPLKHLSVGAEVGLHGFGVEIAVPVQKHLVLKAGYNFGPSGDIFNTDVNIDTKELMDKQTELETLDPTCHFNHHFGEESTVNAGVKLGLNNYKVMLNYYPFLNRKLYLAGGIYYSASGSGKQSLITLSGNTTENDWSALQELNDYLEDKGQDRRDIELPLGPDYVVREKDGRGNMEADFAIDPLKYYVGLGLGRCIPNGKVGLQFEVGAMIYHNSVLYCQDKEVKIESVGDSFGDDVDEILKNVDKYPIYPQVSLRISFRAF